MIPANILARLEEKYLTCESYLDEGFVEFLVRKENRERILFKTIFHRPDYLCFEWQDYGPRRGKSESFSFVLWNEDQIVYRHGETGELIDYSSDLKLALAAATGSSVGAASIVPTLLMTDLREGCRHLLSLADVSSEHSSNENFVLRGSLLGKDDHLLWISKADYSLNRVKHESEIDYEMAIENMEGNRKLKNTFVADYWYTKRSFDNVVGKRTAPMLN